MICRLGVLFVVLAHTCVTSALPPCVCTREAKPVCGTDGRTYDNECVLQCQQQTQPSLQLASRGRCRSVREAGDRETCMSTCTLEYAPVCASDGSSYGNRCAVGCQNRSLEVVHEGVCKSPCICTGPAAPVCGTDGNTYSNGCMLNCARKEQRAESYLYPEYPGPCRDRDNEPEADRNPQACNCASDQRTVCASDGRTFTNECLMRCADKDLTVKSYGPCDYQEY